LKNIISALLLLTFYIHSFSQPLVEVKAEADSHGDYQFTCVNHGYCNYILEIEFSMIQNLRSDFKSTYVGTVSPGQNFLFKLKKEAENQATNFRYTTRFIKGCVTPKINTAYTYLLPIAPGKQTQITELSYFMKKFANEEEPKDWYAIAIKMNAGDTVFASRRGTVMEVVAGVVLKESGYTMSTNDNFVEISHDDCSFGRYQVFKENQIFVRPGQFVEAGEPLGIVGGEKYASGPHVRFYVYYNIGGKDAFKDIEKSYAANHYGYVPMIFWARDIGKGRLNNNGNYTSEHPVDLVTSGMNKRELKKWKDKHPN
jgi:hypothetical protein